MARIETNIVGRLSVEQFKDLKGINKMKVRPVYSGSGENKKPLCFDGTTIQKWAVNDDLGNTHAWVSQKVCEAMAEGTHKKGMPMCVIQSEGVEEDVCFFTLSYVADQSEAVDFDDMF